MGFTRAKTDDMEMVSINFDGTDSCAGSDDVTLLRNRRRDFFYYFHDLSRLHPRKCGAFFAILLICVPISIAFGVVGSQEPETLYRWATYPMWVEENAAYSYSGMVATDDVRCSELGVEVMETLGTTQCMHLADVL